MDRSVVIAILFGVLVYVDVYEHVLSTNLKRTVNSIKMIVRRNTIDQVFRNQDPVLVDIGLINQIHNLVSRNDNVVAHDEWLIVLEAFDEWYILFVNEEPTELFKLIPLLFISEDVCFTINNDKGGIIKLSE